MGRQGWLAPMVLNAWQGTGAPMTMGSPRPPRVTCLVVVKRSTSMWRGVVDVWSEKWMDFWMPAAVLVKVMVMFVGASVLKRRFLRFVYWMVVVEGDGVSTTSVM